MLFFLAGLNEVCNSTFDWYVCELRSNSRHPPLTEDTLVKLSSGGGLCLNFTKSMLQQKYSTSRRKTTILTNFDLNLE